MAQPVIQTSFNSGEWAPHLWARVDIAKYHSGAALLRNFFVDYRGGASTRVGTKYVLQAYKSASAVRLIPFQASLSVRFVLEFGDQYVRFHQNGAPILEGAIAITGATQANPCVLSITNTWSVGDWIFVAGVGGMTQLNGKYYVVHARTGGTVTLYDLFGNPVDATAFGAYTAGGTAARVFTLATPYAAADLATLKFTQNVGAMIFCHPSYVPYVLTYATSISWTLAPITFGTSISAPTGIGVATTLTPSAGGGLYYSYIITAVDSNNQESSSSNPATLSNKQDLRVTSGTNTISWNGVSGAQSYNIYKAELAVDNPVPAGVPHGYIGNCTGTSFIDSNIAPDFSTTPPIIRTPFISGSAVSAVNITAGGSYTATCTVTIAAAPAGGTTATGTPSFGAVSAVVSAKGNNYAVSDTITFANGVIVTVSGIDGASGVTSVNITNPGNVVTTIPGQPQAQVLTSGAGTGCTLTITYNVTSITITNNGAGYLTAPGVTFSAGAATATTSLGPTGIGNPSVPAFCQQRLVMAGSVSNPQAIVFSQPGEYYNYNVSNPIQPDDSISASIVSGQLNNIKAMLAQPSGLIVLTDGASFLVNGGSLGSAITPSTITSNAQSFLGCNDMPPIVVNADVLYVQSKGSSVRDASYNFYAQVFTGSDISVIASHLFFGYQLTEWAWAEEPYKIVWAVRNDGTLLSLTFLKEQEFTAWTHHDTLGSFKSVATIVEPATVGYQNFLYCVVQRTVQGHSLQYIEYMPERLYTNGVQDAYTVDCSYRYSGSPATSFTGATALAGLTCTGLADGIIIPSFTMPANGSFTLGVAASKVTVGLAFLPQLQTLYLDVGEPTIQSKMKKIPAGTLRVTETLGLRIGTDFNNLTDMKDLTRGNVGSMTNAIVTDLVTGDARTFLDPKWQEQGVYCVEQTYPYPATILGVVPQLTVGDTPK